jgi:hypothetical protein
MTAKLVNSGEAAFGRATWHLAHMYLFVFLQMRPVCNGQCHGSKADDFAPSVLQGV